MKPLKIALIQTLPGKEFEVVKSLSDACSQKDIPNYFFLKALGGFDLIAIYEDENFVNDSILEYGPINYLTNHNKLFCYQLDDSSYIESLKGSEFVGVIRFTFDSKKYTPLDVEKIFLKELNGIVMPEDPVINTLVDLLILIPRCDFSEILTTLKNIHRYFESFEYIDNFKTYSYLCLNYSTIFNGEFDTDSYIDLISNRAFFNKNFSENLSCYIDTNIFPSLNITAKPIHQKEIKEHFLNYPYMVSSSLGYQDLIVRPRLFTAQTDETECLDKRESLYSKVTWADFIYDLLNFRYYFGKLIQSTNTSISYNWESGADDYDKGYTCNQKAISHLENDSFYTFSELKFLFEERAGSVARHLSSYDRLKRDTVFKSAYSDMLLYPYYILVQASKKTAIINEIQSQSNSTADIAPIRYERALLSRISCDSLAIGCDIRSYGIHVNVEQRNTRFAKIKGGIRKALLAIEYIPTKIFMQATIAPWYGFVNIWEQSHISQIEQVIYIPQRLLWDPKNWWILWHECAHIFIDTDGQRSEDTNSYPIVSEESPAVRAFLSDKNLRSTWISFLNEVAAEILGYELGFCENYDLFFISFWRYLSSIRESGSHLRNIEPYIIRTFIVFLWTLYKKRDVNSLFAQLLNDADSLHEHLLVHISKVETILKTTLNNKDRLIADSIGIIKELSPFIKHIEESVIGYESFETTRPLTIQSKKEWLMEKNTQDVLKSLKKGKQWHGNIKYPQAIIIGLLNYFNSNINIDSDHEFSVNLATILSFYNQQLHHINTNIVPNPAKYVGLSKNS